MPTARERGDLRIPGQMRCFRANRRYSVGCVLASRLATIQRPGTDGRAVTLSRVRLARIVSGLARVRFGWLAIVRVQQRAQDEHHRSKNGDGVRLAPSLRA